MFGSYSEEEFTRLKLKFFCKNLLLPIKKSLKELNIWWVAVRESTT